MKSELGLIWDAIIENDIATEKELKLVTDICGYSKSTLEDVIYARTGFRNMQQLGIFIPKRR